MRALPDFAALLRPVRDAARDLPPEARPVLFGALAAVQAELLVAPPAPPPDPADLLLSPAQVAERLGRSRDWVYRQRHALPTTPLPGGGGRWGVRESRLRRWMDARSRP